MTVHHDPETQEFTAADGRAELAYSLPAQGVIDFNHTYVDDELRGRGVADQLARAALAYAREHHLKARTSCEFMAAFAQRHHQEYADVLER